VLYDNIGVRTGDGFVIPADRRIDWKPGVPGGIPSYPLFASVLDAPYSASADGNSDDTHAIQQAINDCPAGKAVRLPKGTYRLTSKLQIRKGIVLRGDGPEQTRLINDDTSDPVIDIVGQVTPKATAPVVLWLFGFVWLFWLRVFFHYGLLMAGLAPKVG